MSEETVPLVKKKKQRKDEHEKKIKMTIVRMLLPQNL